MPFAPVNIFNSGFAERKKIIGSTAGVFGILWIVTFLLYFPDVRAGRVGDYIEWLGKIKTLKFLDFINWNIAGMAELYQFTQLVTWCIFKVVGSNAWAWHFIHISLHAVNCTLLFSICRRLFFDAGLKCYFEIAFVGVLIFCISPMVSEAIVYKPAFHFLLSLTLMFAILKSVQLYFHKQDTKYLVFAGITYFLSIFSLELFILTPLLTLVLSLYYRNELKSVNTFKKIILSIFLPQLIITIFYFLLIKIVFVNRYPHNGLPYSFSDYASKSMKYIFHIFLLGRYHPNEIKMKVYEILDSKLAVNTFFSVLTILFAFIILRYKHFGKQKRQIVLFFIFCLIIMLLLAMLWFPVDLLILNDRYSLILDCFIYMLFALYFFLITSKTVRAIAIVLITAINLFFTVQVNTYWKYSAIIQDNLINSFPNPGNKSVILLSLPQCLNGALIVRAMPECEFKTLYNLWSPKKIGNSVYNIASYNLIAPNNGTHVVVTNDSTVRVILNQWGSWWWYGDHGATSRQVPEYRLDMFDAGHQYDLILRQPHEKFMLLYEVAGIWKEVNWTLKNVEQK